MESLVFSLSGHIREEQVEDLPGLKRVFTVDLGEEGTI